MLFITATEVLPAQVQRGDDNDLFQGLASDLLNNGLTNR
jgi:hypothetical protein